MTMTEREAVLKAAEIARQTARCPRNAVGVARDEISGWFSADQYREEGADAVADALSAFADTLTAEREAVLKAAECRSAVPILPGEMPDEMWEVLSTDRDAATEALRILVRQTLDEYEQAIRAFADTLTEGPQTERDAARYRWLRKLYDGVDFEYGEEFGEKCPALIFEWPVGMRVSANLDDTLDAAMSADSDRAKDATQE